MKQIAVIILNWNGAALLREFLPSVVANTNAELADVIVADNGSTDDSLLVLREEFPLVKVLEFPENYGFAEGYNRAVAATRYPMTLLLNSDVEVQEGWIEPLAAYMGANPECGACQPKILSYKDKGSFEYAGASGGLLDRNGYPYCRGRLFDTTEKDRGQYDTPMKVMWASGAALLVRSALYEEVGGLDKEFFAHMEEIDLCWRIQLAGHTVDVVPASCVYHLGGGSLPASNPRKTYLNFRNNLLLLHKNLPRRDLFATLLRRRLLDTLAWAKFIASFDFANAGAVLKAHRDFRRMRRLYTSHPSRNLLREPLQRRNIILSYYLLRRKTYSSL